MSTPTKFLPLHRPPITTPCHKDGRVFTYHLEPSRRLRCTVVSHHRCRLCLPSSALRRSDSGANRSVTRPRVGCFAAGQLLPHLCAPLGRPVPSLTEASRTLLRQSTAVKVAVPPRCRRQAPGDKASRSVSTSSSPGGTMGWRRLGRSPAA
jgi:hypothetical protein